MSQATVIIELNQLYAAGKFEELVKHPGIYLKPEWAMEVASNADRDVRLTLAENQALAQLPEVAMKLAGDKEFNVRLTLAENQALAQLPEVAMKLAGDLTVVVRETISENPAVKTFKKVLTKASQRTFKYCTVEWVEWEPGRYGSLRHPVKVERSAENCTVTFTAGMAHIVLPSGRKLTKRRSTESWTYRAHRRPTKTRPHPAIAAKLEPTKMTPEVAKVEPELAKIELEQLVAAENWEALAQHPMIHLKPEVALALSQDRVDSVRRALASNPAISYSPDLVLTLSQDPSPAVRSSLPRKIRLAALRQIEESTNANLLAKS